MQESKYSNSSGKQRVSGGFKPGNMNAFIFCNNKRKRRVTKRTRK